VAKGEFQAKPKPGVAGDVIVAGESVNLDAITDLYITHQAAVIEVFVPIGDSILSLKFNRYPRQSEYRALLRDAADFYRGLPSFGSDAQKGHPWAAFWPMDAQEYVDAYMVANLSLEPKIAIETALKWLAHPNLISSILDQVETASKTVATVTLATLIDAKKKSWREAASGETSLESASKQSDDSPAS